MPNTHQQHPEDSILTGDLRAVRDLYSRGHVSLKIDGAPSVVWGHFKGNSLYVPKIHSTRKSLVFVTTLRTSIHISVINLMCRYVVPDVEVYPS